MTVGNGGDIFRAIEWLAINLLLLFLLFCAIWKVVRAELRQLQRRRGRGSRDHL